MSGTKPGPRRQFEIEKELLQKYLEMHMTYKDIADKFGCSSWTVMARAKEYGLKSDARKRQMVTDNPRAHEEVRKRVSITIAKMWEDGSYSDRVNGMAGLVGELYPGYDPAGSKFSYRDKAKFYHPEAVCLCCGKQLSWDDNSIEVHHVDGDHENYALTNLMPLCHSCHRKYHRKSQPIMQICKSFVFDACHFLPYHDRKCKFLHGHTYHMEICIQNRVLQETGMVIDFGDLKKAVNEEIIEQFDHGFLNQYVEYPTCEMMIAWMWAKLSKRIKGLKHIKVYETDGSYCMMTDEIAKQYLREFECDWTRTSEMMYDEEEGYDEPDDTAGI